MVDSSGANLVTGCRGFGGTELKARDVCSIQDVCSVMGERLLSAVGMRRRKNLLQGVEFQKN